MPKPSHRLTRIAVALALAALVWAGMLAHLHQDPGCVLCRIAQPLPSPAPAAEDSCPLVAIGWNPPAEDPSLEAHPAIHEILSRPPPAA